MKNQLRRISRLALVLVTLVGCNKQSASASSKTATNAKVDEPAAASPLLYSLSEDEVKDLRKRMSKSIIVVAYDGRTLDLLPKCSAAGEYLLMAIDEKKTTLKLETADDVALNIPRTPSQTKLPSGLSLNLLITGKWTATRPMLERKMLVGDCSKATHFIHHLDSGIISPIHKPMGDCPDDYDGEHECATPFRAHLHPFGEGPPWDLVRAMPPLYCPEKTFVTEQMCSAAKPFEPYACRFGDKDECEKQCTIGNTSSCNTLGWALARISTDAQEITFALKMLDRACDGGEVRACGNLALATIGNHIPITNGEAAELYTKSCLRGDEESCLLMGDMMAASPELVDDAKPYFMQACFGGLAEGCGRGALTLENEGAESAALARVLHQRACGEGYQPSCVRWGVMLVHALGGPVDAAAGKQLLEGACGKDNADACAHLGFVYQNAVGAGQDYVKAGEFYDKACNGNSAYGCRMLAIMHESALGRPRDMTRAAGLFAKGCSMGEPDSCLELGRLHTTGEGILKDERRAVELFESTCNQGLVVGCHNLAILLADGKGAPQNAERARELHEKACKVGYSRSCRMLGTAKP